MQLRNVLLLTLFILAACQEIPVLEDKQPIETEQTTIYVEQLASELQHPWALAFIDQEQALITQRPGTLTLINISSGEQTTIHGLPEIHAEGQGGLLDVAINPTNTSKIFFSYSKPYQEGTTTALATATLRGEELVNVTTLFRASPPGTTDRHYGSRIALNETHLYLTIGDRGERERAQNLGDHAGSVIRLYLNGSTPPNNPFINDSEAHKEIYTYGHRNPQGLLIHPETNEVWVHEHGPRGGDEINVLEAGSNYGWPNFTHGTEYYGPSIGVDTPPENVKAPVHHWSPTSIAPSGFTYYDAQEISQWTNNFFVGALAQQRISRLEITNHTVIHEEHFLVETIGRIRDVRTGPDGYLYVLTDRSNGGLYRITA